MPTMPRQQISEADARPEGCDGVAQGGRKGRRETALRWSTAGSRTVAAFLICGAAAAAQDKPAVPSSAAATSETGQNFTFPADGPLRIVGDESRYRIELPSDILFDFDRSELRPEAEPLLKAVREHFVRTRADQVLVSGHTDAKGTPEHNYVLSQKRATAVCDWLKQALDRPFTSCIGRGEDEPLVAETKADGSDDPEGRQRNRRVQIAVVVYPDAKALLDRAREQAQGVDAGQP